MTKNEYHVNCINGELEDIIDRITLSIRTTSTDPEETRIKLIKSYGIILEDISRAKESLKMIQ